MSMGLLARSALTGVKIAAIVALLGVLYGLAAHRVIIHTYAVNANFAVGAVILISGLVRFVTPTSLLVKKGRLVDHTTYREKWEEARDRKHLSAYELIYIGIACISVTAIMQLLLHLVLQR